MRTLRLALLIVACLCGGPVHAAAGKDRCPLYPNDTPEVARLRELACSGNFEEIERHIARVQRDYEARRIDERAMFLPYVAFNLPFDVPGVLDAWLRKYPNSYGAHVAAGRQHIHRGTAARGTRLAMDTGRQQFAEMNAHFALATKHLEHSIGLSTRPYASYNYLIMMGKYQRRHCAEWGVWTLWRHPNPCLRKLLDKALALDPQGYYPRWHYMSSLEPRWGGSIQAMEAFYKEAEKAQLKPDDLGKLRAPLLAQMASVESRPEEKLRLATEANRLVENSEHLHHIVHAQSMLKRYAEVVPTATRALELQPGHAWTHMRRGSAYWELGRDAEACADFLAAAKLGDAFSQNKVGYCLWVGKGVAQDRAEAVKWWQKGAAGGDKDAVRNLQEAKAHGLVK